MGTQTQYIFSTSFEDSSLYVVADKLEHIPHNQIFLDKKCLAHDRKPIVIGRISKCFITYYKTMYQKAYNNKTI
jgi:hypothetical protein